KSELGTRNRRAGAGSRVPRSHFHVPRWCVSNCHMPTKCLDCPHKYGARVPTADLRRPGGADRRDGRPGGGGRGDRGRSGRLRRPGAPPGGPARRGAPEFAALRHALRELATALDAARERELEAERLRAFREVARRVAHEIKNPLTSMRIAVDQLGRTVGQADSRTATAVEVLGAETQRLGQLAKEFADFGRLPEGPKSEVDLVDLLMDLGKSAVPPEVAVRVRANGEHCNVTGASDHMRR